MTETREGLLIANAGFVGDIRKALGWDTEHTIPFDTPVFVRANGELQRISAILYTDDTEAVIIEVGAL